MTSCRSGSWNSRPTTAAPGRARTLHLRPIHEQPTPPLPGDLVRDEAGEGERERALAGPGRPDDEEALPGLHGERDVAQRRLRRAGIREPDPVGDDAGRSGEGGVAQAGKPSSAPLRRSAFTSPVATSGRIRRPEMAMNTAIAASAAVSYVA